MFFFSIPVPIPKHPKSSEDLLHKALRNGHLLYNTARTDYM